MDQYLKVSLLVLLFNSKANQSALSQQFFHFILRILINLLCEEPFSRLSIPKASAFVMVGVDCDFRDSGDVVVMTDLSSSILCVEDLACDDV